MKANKISLPERLIRMAVILVFLLGLYDAAFCQTTKTFGAAAIEDAYITSSTPNRNFGASTSLLVQSTPRFLIWFDQQHWDTLGSGKLITGMVCSLYLSSTVDGDTIMGKGIFKQDIIEGIGTSGTDSVGVCWNYFNSDLAYNWGTAGCASEDNIATGTFNTTDGGGDDRTAEWVTDTIFATTGSTWYIFHIDTAYANKAYLTDADFGLLVASAGTNTNATFRSTEIPTTSIRPRFGITYEDAPAPPGTAGKRIMVMKK